MQLASKNAWSLGFIVILLFIILSELSFFFGEYLFHRLGISRNLVLILLWGLPLLAAFLTSYYAREHKLILGLSFLLIVPLLGTAAHYSNWKIGAAVDFGGVSGAIAILKIYFVINSLLVLIGTGLGLLLSKTK